MNRIGNGLKSALDWGAQIRNDADPLLKVCKITTLINTSVGAIGKIAEVSTKSFVALGNLAQYTSKTAELGGALNVVPRAKDWLLKGEGIGPDGTDDYYWMFLKKGKITKNVFQADKYWSGAKTTSRVFLTFAHATGFVRFLGSVKLLKVHPLAFVAQGLFYIPTAIFGIKSIFESYFDDKAIVSSGDRKESNWYTKKIVLLNPGKNEIEVETKDGKKLKIDLKKQRENYLKKYKNKIEKVNNALEHYNQFKEQAESYKENQNELQKKLSELISDAMEKRFGPITEEGLQENLKKVNEKIEKYKTYVTAFSAPDNNNNLDEKDVNKAKAKVKALCDKKIEHWGDVKETLENNASKLKVKYMWDLANNVGKLVFGIMGLVGFFVGVSTLPLFVLTLSIGWIATEACGLGKWTHSNNVSNKTDSVSEIIPNSRKIWGSLSAA